MRADLETAMLQLGPERTTVFRPLRSRPSSAMSPRARATDRKNAYRRSPVLKSVIQEGS